MSACESSGGYSTVPNKRVETLIVGGGQAGLVMSHMLSQRGCPHLVLERPTIGAPNAGIPNWSVRLPDFPFLPASAA